MKPTELSFFAKAADAEMFGESVRICGVDIDSRRVGDGFLFVCIKGDVNDGHDYLQGAYELGCRAFLVSDSEKIAAFYEKHGDISYILTSDTENAFVRCAMAYLGQFSLIRAAVTGSTGKTSTKAFAAAVMGCRYNTVCTRRNYNSKLGICMTAFLADEHTQAVVFEVGMDRPGEIRAHCDFLRPDIALITNIGTVHMEYLGTQENIAREKLSVASFFGKSQTLIYNCDSPYLQNGDAERLCGVDCRYMPVGTSDEAAVKISDIRDKGTDGISFDISADGASQTVTLPFLGVHNAHNAALAAALGLQYGISLEESSAALCGAVFEDQRLQRHALSINGSACLLLDDSYNANPDSMAAGLRTLAGIKAKKHIAVISAMRELGTASDSAHRQIGMLASDLGLNLVLAVGENSGLYAQGAASAERPAMLICLSDAEEAAKYISDHDMEDDSVILVKGSNSTGISAVSKELIRKYKK